MHKITISKILGWPNNCNDDFITTLQKVNNINNNDPAPILLYNKDDYNKHRKAISKEIKLEKERLIPAYVYYILNIITHQLNNYKDPKPFESHFNFNHHNTLKYHNDIIFWSKIFLKIEKRLKRMNYEINIIKVENYKYRFEIN